MTLDEIATLALDQRFGVEVECCGIDRKTAAEVAAGCLDGCVRQLSDGKNPSWAAVSGDREWKFSIDPAIEWGESREKCELDTPILGYCDIPALQKVLVAMGDAGAVSDPEYVCAVHIHVGIDPKGDEHTPRSLANLVTMFYQRELQIVRYMPILPARIDRFAQLSSKEFAERLNGPRPNNVREVSNLWRRYDGVRSRLVSLRPICTYGTVEYRIFQFTHKELDAKNMARLRAWIEFALLTSEYAKHCDDIRDVCHGDADDFGSYAEWIDSIGFSVGSLSESRDMILSGDERMELLGERQNSHGTDADDRISVDIDER